MQIVILELKIKMKNSRLWMTCKQKNNGYLKI